jgi:hypothetical protein
MRTLKGAVVVGAGLLLGACAHGSARPARGVDLPDDFALGVTVLPVKGAPGAMAPAWYVLEPDDQLRVALGERLAASTYPPAVRTLTREQVRRVWGLVVDAGLVGGNEPSLPHWHVAAPNACAVVYVAAEGRRRSFAVPAERAGAVEPVVAELRRMGSVRE